MARKGSSEGEPSRLTCQEVVEFLDAYRLGELAPAEQTRFTSHLGECPECVDYLAAYERTIALAKAALAGPDEPLPTDVPEDLVRAILAARPRS